MSNPTPPAAPRDAPAGAHSPTYKAYAVAWAGFGAGLLVVALPAVPHLPAAYLLFVALSVAGNFISIRLLPGITLSMQASLAPVWLFGWQAGPPLYFVAAIVLATCQRITLWRAALFFGNASAWVVAAGLLFRRLQPLPAGSASWEDLLAAVLSAALFVAGNVLTVTLSRLLDSGDRACFHTRRLAWLGGITFAGLMPLSYLLTITHQTGPAPQVLTVTVWLLAAVALKGFVETREANRRLEQALREVHELSITDPLTGLFNRRHFNEVLAREVQRHLRHAQPLSLLIMDLRGFKGVNDTYGHPAGDDVLAQVAAVIRARLRHSDVAFRIGGDEFAALLPQTDREGALRVATTLSRQIANASFTVRDAPVALAAAIGVATLPDDATTSEALMQAADGALYATRRADSEAAAERSLAC
ncbi:MAG: GGDEF domain-containing protein [Armatimonadota bacterium]|nr:GGDEF domain-containing protein [Armatimonadota bacterium]MDR5696753.1 GGDEF domain-containing protein [Armatimonadota bacterium]